MVRRILILSSLALYPSIMVSAQTAPAPAPPAPSPAAPQAAPPAAPRPAARAPVQARPVTLTVQVTDTMGAPLADAKVAISGSVDREGVSLPDGSLRFLNMRAGNYRLRFMREGSTTLERDITIRNNEPLTVDVALTPAPPPPKAPDPVKLASEPVTKALPPPGDPKVTPIPQFLDKNFIPVREGRKDSPLGCSATGTATLHQLREAWLGHAHEGADEWIYVVAGEGTLRIGSSEQKVQAGTFSLVPHATPHAVVPLGRNPLIVVSVMSGPACTP